MKKDFLTYVQNEFNFTENEMKDFEIGLSKPLKKSIRINTNKISIDDFKKLAEKKGWILTPSGYGTNLFYIDRVYDLDVPLGNTLEHTNGYFYIQEVAASSSPFYLSGDTIHQDKLLILDMSASPGWKTTSLSEYYPNAIIIANELDKKRLKTLFENSDRMGSENVVITNYDGRFFRNYENTFDRILLDAPCSGEGTAFKTDDALKYWNIKNIKNIAKLQLGLLESALIALKEWGEIIYSTCTINTIENEGVIEKVMEKYGDSLEIIPINTPNETSRKMMDFSWKSSTGTNCSKSTVSEETQDLSGKDAFLWSFKRNWPHKDNTGWFFVAKLRKTWKIENEKQKYIDRITQNLKKIPNKLEKHITSFLQDTFDFDSSNKHFWIYGESVYMTNKSMQDIDELFFFYKVWVQIGNIIAWEFEPNFFFWTLRKITKNTLSISEKDFHTLMQGYELPTKEKDGYYALTCNTTQAGIGKVKWGKLKSLIPAKFIRS